MLYKKIHRQHLRQFWVGRKFRYNGISVNLLSGGTFIEGRVYEITREPYIGERGYIHFRFNKDALCLINSRGEIYQCDFITWID